MSSGPNSARAWHTRSEQELLCARPWFRVVQQEVALPSGRVIDDFYRIEMPDFASVLAKRADRRIVLVRGYKHGIGEETLLPPAGLIESGEEPLAAAQRELLEETGYESDSWQALGAFVVDANRHCGRMHLFLALNAKQVAAPRVDETEDLQTELMSSSELQSAIRNGEFKNLAGLATAVMCFALDMAVAST